jgi:hypothetical protein
VYCFLFPLIDKIGVWERSADDNTLTFTSTTVTSAWGDPWNLQSVSGDSYTIKHSKNGETITITIKLVNGNIVISNDPDLSAYTWNGTWTKK